MMTNGGPEGRIFISHPHTHDRVFAVCHHKACSVMTNGDPEGWILISCPHTNNRSFSCSPLNNTFYV